jgi:hypothetical protein
VGYRAMDRRPFFRVGRDGLWSWSIKEMLDSELALGGEVDQGGVGVTNICINRKELKIRTNSTRNSNSCRYTSHELV